MTPASLADPEGPRHPPCLPYIFYRAISGIFNGKKPIVSKFWAQGPPPLGQNSEHCPLTNILNRPLGSSALSRNLDITAPGIDRFTQKNSSQLKEHTLNVCHFCFNSPRAIETEPVQSSWGLDPGQFRKNSSQSWDRLFLCGTLRSSVRIY